MCMYRIHIRMYTARTCTCIHTCTHTFIPWSARVRSFLRASSSACALALLFVASCAQSPFVCVCECVCVCVTVCVYVCGECNRDHHSEFLRAGMHAPPASCQRDLLSGTKSRQREEDSEGLKCLFTLSLHLRLSSFRHASKPLACLAWKPNNFWLSSCK